MKFFLSASLVLCAVLSGCSTPGGMTVTNVSAQTKNDLAACGMGLSSSTELNAAASMEQNGGKIGVIAKDDLRTAYVAKFGEKDALAAMDKFQVCMDKQRNDRIVDQKKADISSCKTAWTCDMNTAAGVCACRKVLQESQKKYGWTDKKMAEEYFSTCDPSKIKQCWAAGDLNNHRARCETVLGDAAVKIPSLNSSTCKLSPS